MRRPRKFAAPTETAPLKLPCGGDYRVLAKGVFLNSQNPIIGIPMKTILRFTAILAIAAILALTVSNSSADIISLYQFDGSTTDEVRGAGGAASLLMGGISFTNGIAGQAFNFDGSTLITAPQAGGGLSAFSISAWVYFNELNSWSTIVKTWGDSVGIYHFGLEASADAFSNYLGSGGEAYAVVGGSPQTGQWYNVAITVGPSLTQSLYINGQLVGNAPASGPLNNNYQLMGMGAKLDDSETGVAYDPGWLVGYMDDLAFFNQELTSTQISQIYTNGLAGNSITTLGYAESPYVNPNTAVPEPGTWAAAAMLLAGAGFMRWRRRAKIV